MANAGLKAGLTGGVVGIILVLLGYTPYIGICIACFGGLALAFGVGVVAVQMGQRKIASVGEGFGVGAIAGAITGFISGLAFTFIDLVLVLSGVSLGFYARFLGQGVVTTLFWDSVICIFNVIFTAMLGGIGGLTFKAVQGSAARPARA